MILINKKAVFIHINKTAGSSIETALGWPYKDATHFTLSDYKNVLPPNYYFFSFVRNPYDKMVSMFEHRKQNLKDNVLINLSFEDWILNLDELGYSDKGTCNQICWLSTQTWIWDIDKQKYITRPKIPKIEIDFVGKFENLNEDWEELKIELEINKSIKLPHRRKSKHIHYSNYYNDKTREVIYNRFEDDFNIFNYKP